MTRVTALLRRTAPVRVWLLLYGLLSVSYLATAWIRHLFAPDTRYYAAKALLWAGNSQAEAYRLVLARTQDAHLVLPPPDITFHVPLTASRVVYPGLSVPFVALWGVDGMAVIPALSFMCLGAVLFVTLARRWGWQVALVPVVLIATSSKVLFFSVLMLTEGPTTLWSALILMVALTQRPGRAWRTGTWLVLLTVVMAFTRQATLIPAGAFFLAWLAMSLRYRTVRNRWLLPTVCVGVTTVVVQVLQDMLWPGFSQIRQFERMTGTSSLADALRATPELFWHIVSTDAKTLAGGDLPLCALIVGNIIAWVVLWRREEAWLSLGSILGALVYNVTNGTPSGFRYEMPALPFMALCFAALVATCAGLQARRREDPARSDTDSPGIASDGGDGDLRVGGAVPV